MIPALIALAKSKTDIENELRQHGRSFIGSLTPLPVGDLFFRHVKKVVREMHRNISRRVPKAHQAGISYATGTLISDTVETATEELARLAALRQNGWRFPEFLAFVVAYDELKTRLYESLDGSYLDRSDDAIGDLIDSLPLAGPAVILAILGGHHSRDEDDRSLVECIDRSLADPGYFKRSPSWLRAAILHGENYIESRLYDAAVGYFYTASSKPLNTMFSPSPGANPDVN